MSPYGQEWFTVLMAALITVGILVLDALLWSVMGLDWTFSRAFNRLYQRWPIVAAMLFLWIGILIGHLLPAKA
jgi:hypothetical protein